MFPLNLIKWSLKSYDFIRITKMVMGIYDVLYCLCLEQNSKEGKWDDFSMGEKIW